jgi:hypothetical protein
MMISLSLVRNQIPVQARKEILKATLQGIADKHDCDIVQLSKPNDWALHTVNTKDSSSVDVKPDKLLVNYHHVDQDFVVEQVQASDLENAAYLPKPRCIKGMLAGDDNWRSPGGHLKES